MSGLWCRKSTFFFRIISPQDIVVVLVESFRMEKHSQKHSETPEKSPKFGEKTIEKHSTVLDKTQYCVKTHKTHVHAETL